MDIRSLYHHKMFFNNKNHISFCANRSENCTKRFEKGLHFVLGLILWTQWTHGPQMTLLTKSLFGFAKGTNCNYFLNPQEIQLCFYPESRFPDMQPVSSQYQNACQHPGYRINHHQHIISFPQRRHDIHPDYPEQTGSENRQQSRSQ